MRAENPLQALSDAMGTAVHRDLPPVKYWHRDWKAWNKLTPEQQKECRMKNDEGPGEWKERRPMPYEVTIQMFTQTWGSTALGYGGGKGLRPIVRPGI